MSYTGFTFRRGVAETLVIVLGVLIALGVDSAWAWRVERVEERNLLMRLQSDFEAAAAEFERAAASHDLQQDGMLEALSVLEAAEDSDGSAGLTARALRRSLGTASSRPPTGALRSAINAGEVRLIENRDLRDELTGWLELLEYLQDEETQERRIYEGVVLPLVFAEAATRFDGIRETLDSEVSELMDLNELTLVLDDDRGRIAASRSYSNALAWRVANKEEVRLALEAIRGSTTRVLELIEDELGGNR